jgi:predicted nucleotidyltransferase component of viral defense system
MALMHYVDYRSTQDVDAWWTDDITAEQQKAVIEAIADSLRPFGLVTTRRWGDVVSVELEEGGRKTFSFQIARRSARLAPPTLAGWLQVPLDSLDDLIASKMVALVERGAPRDFRDIYELCRCGLADPARCWDLWRRRQELAGSDPDRDRARLAILTHLERIRQHRRLQDIPDPELRGQAERTRRWFGEEFLR